MKEQSKISENGIVNIQQYFQMVDKVKTSEAIKLYKLLSGTRQSFIIYKYNHIRLKKRLTRYYQDQLNTFNDDIKRWRIQRKIIGDFHNVISSAQHFIEYLKKGKRQTNFKDELESELKSRFISNELYEFIFVLRNYISHVNRLPLISRMELVKDKKRINPISYESLDKRKMLEYIESEKPKYSQAKSFLNRSEDFINLNDVIFDFDKNLNGMYDWFVQKFTKANKLKIEELVFITEECFSFAKNFGFEQSIPLNKIQVRHLKILLANIE